MSSDWLQKLEKRLNEPFSNFLKNHHSHKSLVQEQEEQDKLTLLINSRTALEELAQKKRIKLIALAELISTWSERSKQAKQDGKVQLSAKAKQKSTLLMEEGSKIWQELSKIGEDLQKIKQTILQLSKQNNSFAQSIEQKWAAFETEQELEQLKRKIKKTD